MSNCPGRYFTRLKKKCLCQKLLTSFLFRWIKKKKIYDHVQGLVRMRRVVELKIILYYKIQWSQTSSKERILQISVLTSTRNDGNSNEATSGHECIVRHIHFFEPSRIPFFASYKFLQKSGGKKIIATCKFSNIIAVIIPDRCFLDASHLIHPV